LSHLYINAIFLPRQGKTKKRLPFSQVDVAGGTGAQPGTPPMQHRL
jgi:hypothetical protein